MIYFYVQLKVMICFFKILDRKGGLMDLMTACGNRLVITRKTIDHLQAHPEAFGLLREAVGMLILPTDGSDFFKTTVDFGRIIGETICVPVPINPEKRQTFTIRKGRTLPSHTVVGASKIPTSHFTMAAFKGRYGDWILITGYAGESDPREPNDRSLVPGSEDFYQALEFWTSHALVYDPEIMGEVYESTWADELKAVAVAV